MALLAEDTTLDAVICTVEGDGKSTGAVYTPSAEIVPVRLLPPVMPFTLQRTPVLLDPLTVAVKFMYFPSRRFPLEGVTSTEMAGGGGGLIFELAPPPPQPGKIAKASDSPNNQPLAKDRF